MEKNKKDYIVKLVVEEYPRTSNSQKKIIEWLKEKIKDIEHSDPDDYAEPFTMKLMK